MSQPCPRCGAQNPPDYAVCSGCGSALSPASAPVGKQTLLGVPAYPVAPQAALPNGQPPAPSAASLKSTMLGFPAMQARPAPPAAAPPAGTSLRGTMLGMAPPVPPAPDPTPSAMQPPASLAPSQIPSQQRTMLGVARPGIAPLNPGQAKPVPVPLPAPSPAPQDLDPFPEPPPLPKTRISVLAASVIVGAGVLLSAAAVALFFYRSHGDVQATPRLDAEGNEQLELRCAGCSDGTIVRHGTNSSKFEQQRALLPLSAPLRIGDNRLQLLLERPDGKRSDRVELTVPVEYRVRGDMKGLEESPPRLFVFVSAVPNSSAVVDGKPLALSGAEARYEIDVSADLTGNEAQVRRLERRIPYTVRPPDGTPRSGVVTLQLGITPLVVDAPGESVVVDKASFMLTGHTEKGATVSVAGAPIAVDATGRFVQAMNVSAPGETTIVVRATAPEHAPRLFPLRVRRVKSLAEEAARLRPSATSSYAALGAGAAGSSVALDGSVVEARVDGFVTRMLLDVTSGCGAPPCLAKVSYAGTAEPPRGSKLSVFGKLKGLVDGPRSGTKIPDIHADFVLRGKR